MLRVSKDRKKRVGFTLLEMVLVLAILCITITYITATFITTQRSHLRVATVNDMHDFASLNLKAIENNLCNATVIGGEVEDLTIRAADDLTSVLLNDDDIIHYQQYHSGAGTDKWGVTLEFTTDKDKKTVHVVIKLIDMDSPSAGVQYKDEKTIYCPSCVDMDVMTNSASISFTKDPQ